MSYDYAAEIDPVEEIVRIREELFEKHGGIKGYAEYIKEKWTPERLEREGWRVVPPEELEAMKHRYDETFPAGENNFPLE